MAGGLAVFRDIVGSVDGEDFLPMVQRLNKELFGTKNKEGLLGESGNVATLWRDMLEEKQNTLKQLARRDDLHGPEHEVKGRLWEMELCLENGASEDLSAAALVDSFLNSTSITDERKAMLTDPGAFQRKEMARTSNSAEQVQKDFQAVLDHPTVVLGTQELTTEKVDDISANPRGDWAGEMHMAFINEIEEDDWDRVRFFPALYSDLDLFSGVDAFLLYDEYLGVDEVSDDPKRTVVTMDFTSTDQGGKIRDRNVGKSEKYDMIVSPQAILPSKYWRSQGVEGFDEADMGKAFVIEASKVNFDGLTRSQAQEKLREILWKKVHPQLVAKLGSRIFQKKQALKSDPNFGDIIDRLDLRHLENQPRQVSAQVSADVSNVLAYQRAV